MADLLVPNPDGCTSFQENPFKKEKCKSCGHPWQSHKGVISDEKVAGLLKAKQDIIDKKERVEAEAKAKARAKNLEKKKATQAVEDEWFNDGTAVGDALDEDSDDNMGFWSATQDTPPRSSTAEHKPLKVKNLIDFTECDVADEECAPLSSQNQTSSKGPEVFAVAPTSLFSLPATTASSSNLSFAMGMTAGSCGGGGGQTSSFTAPVSNEASLLSEIDHLRQVLADTNEEKNIQVSFFKDELDSLRKDKAEVTAELITYKEREVLACAAVSKADDLACEVISKPQDDVLKAMAQELESTQQLATAERDRLLLQTEKQQEEIQELRMQLELARSTPVLSSADQTAGEVATIEHPVSVIVAGAGTVSVNGTYKILDGSEQGGRPVYVHTQRVGYKIQWSAGRNFWMVDDVEGDAPYKIDGRDDISIPLDAEWTVYQGGKIPAPRVSDGSKCSEPLGQTMAANCSDQVASPITQLAFTKTLKDLHTLSSDTLRVLGEEHHMLEANSDEENSRPIEVEFDGLKSKLVAASKAAERHMSERRLLLEKMRNSALAGESGEKLAAQQSMSQQAARALREVRLNAERQLGWVRQRRCPR